MKGTAHKGCNADMLARIYQEACMLVHESTRGVLIIISRKSNTFHSFLLTLPLFCSVNWWVDRIQLIVTGLQIG